MCSSTAFEDLVLYTLDWLLILGHLVDACARWAWTRSIMRNSDGMRKVESIVMDYYIGSYARVSGRISEVRSLEIALL